jgi:hypothetical protein
VRTKTWQIESILEQDDAVAVSMVTEGDQQTRRWWPGEFRLLHRASCGSQQKLELICTNNDGQGLTLAHTAGLSTGCIRGRESAALMRRAKEMKMEFIYMKQPLKMPAYEEILEKAGVSDSAVAYIGDDLPDIPLLLRWSRHRRGQCRPRSQTGRALHYENPPRPWRGARSR